ncbi:MAG: rod shape-determining protein MreC [Spirosomaceae bacterium]|nr:rod shape-determining protein MreC [Spirosomataceae bacterium]
MSQLLQLFYRIRHFFLFILFELISIWLLVQNNNYWGVSYFNSSNYYIAKSLEANRSLTEYVDLKDVNKSLAKENIALKKQLVQFQQADTNPSGLYKPDSVFARRFDFKVAKVVKNTVNLTNNYITIDLGSLDGIKPGMGVIGPQGIVGQIKSCSEHFSIVYSILHSRFSVSSEVLNQKLRQDEVQALGIGKWDGSNPRFFKLTTIDRFKPITKGDSVVTSEQNSIFPSKTMVGKVAEIKVGRDNAFFDIDVKLATDFSSITYVYVVENKMIAEQKSLEDSITEN